MATSDKAEAPRGDKDRQARIAELEEEVRRLKRGAGQAPQTTETVRDQAVSLMHHLMDHAPVGFVVFDPDLRFMAINERLADLNGVPAADHIGRSVDEVIPALAPRIRQAFQIVTATGRPLLDGQASGETPKAPGQIRHWSASWYPLHDPEGRFFGMGGVVSEITGRREIEDALRVSQKRLELAQEAAGVAVYDWDIAAGEGHCSEGFCPLYGLPPSDRGPSHEEWLASIHPEDRTLVLEATLRQMNEGVPCNTEFRVVWPDGSVHWLLAKGQLIRDALGNPVRTVGVNMDITEHKRAEAAVRESEERFRNLANTAPVMIWTSDARDHIDFGNRFALSFMGRTMDQLVQEGWGDLIHAEDQERQLAKRAARLASHGSCESEFRMRRADGEYRWLLATAQPRFLASGDFAGYVGITVDITEHKHAEQRLRELSTALMRLQDEERRRIGRELHDSTGQNLASLKLNLSRLSQASLPPDLENIVPESLALTERMLSEIRTLSYLLHPPLLDELGLTSALKTYIGGFSGRSGIQVHFEVPPDLGRLAPELETAIFRIIQEGLTNAHRHSGASQCWVDITWNEKTASLVVRDDGVGLPELALRHLKQEPGRLPGVGLPGMQERARQLGGSLEIESDLRGCVIRATFPVARR